MDWMFLLLAGAAEVGGVISMKKSQGFKRLIPTLFSALFGIISFASLSQAMRTIPMGTAYGVWTGIGSAGSVLLGMLVWRDKFTWQRLALLLCILVGVIGLKMS